MLVRMSTLFLRTLREDPADAEVPSHRLLVRAGYIRRVAAGIYSWLPLGVRVLANVAAVVREEIDAIGGQEVLFPALLPREFYDVTGRTEVYGPDLFRVTDRKGGEYVLGPTHEEMFALLVKGEYSSYRDLPLTLYQIQTKYRDEPRPRSGVMRGREFVMKDSYSFDLDDAGLDAAYGRHRVAYARVFSRLGLDFRVVSAVSGAMGGSRSEEFLAPSPVGEDTYVACTDCDYAANVEAVESGPVAVPPASAEGLPEPEEIATPGTTTIEALAGAVPGLTAAETLKCMLVTVDGEPAAVCVPGDRDVDLGRLDAALAPATVELFDDAAFAAHPDLVRGYAGPQGMADRKVRVYADPRVAAGTAWVVGANRADHHVRGVVAGRDFSVDRFLDVATVAAGDPCPRCGGRLTFDRAIEIGHIFALGRRYTDAFSVDVAAPDGSPVRLTMGSYGIGVSRAVAAVAEQTHDDAGLAWPASIAPFDVHVLSVGRGEPRDVADRIATELSDAGRKVLVDDRGLAAGVAFADADLLGMPTIVIVGRALADGAVEVKDRRTGARRTVPVQSVVGELTAVAEDQSTRDQSARDQSTRDRATN